VLNQYVAHVDQVRGRKHVVVSTESISRQVVNGFKYTITSTLNDGQQTNKHVTHIKSNGDGTFSLLQNNVLAPTDTATQHSSALALGLGLGIGLPVFMIAAVAVFLLVRRARQKSASPSDSAQEPLTATLMAE